VLVLRDGRLAGELVGDEVSMETLGRLQLAAGSPGRGSSETNAG
jgi:hypothetical protein